MIATLYGTTGRAIRRGTPWAIVVALVLVVAAGLDPARADAPPSSPVAEALAEVRFVAYVPRSFSIHAGVPQAATRAGIRADLRALRPYFSGLVTYGLGNGQTAIPELAEAAGFRALVLGVWDPTDRVELDAAIRLARAHPDLVIALVLGNEGLIWNRYGVTDLAAAAAYVRARLPNLALGSSEPFALYLDPAYGPTLLGLDWLAPNVHPRFEPWFDPADVAQAADFVLEVAAKLRATTAKPILVKETGLPSAPGEQGFTERRQAEFWARLAQRLAPDPTLGVAYFEAFDAPWKPRELQDEFGRLEASEAHWGLLRGDGTPKPALEALAPLPDPAPAARESR